MLRERSHGKERITGFTSQSDQAEQRVPGRIEKMAAHSAVKWRGGVKDIPIISVAGMTGGFVQI